MSYCTKTAFCFNFKLKNGYLVLDTVILFWKTAPKNKIMTVKLPKQVVMGVTKLCNVINQTIQNII